MVHVFLRFKRRVHSLSSPRTERGILRTEKGCRRPKTGLGNANADAVTCSAGASWPSFPIRPGSGGAPMITIQGIISSNRWPPFPNLHAEVGVQASKGGDIDLWQVLSLTESSESIHRRPQFGNARSGHWQPFACALLTTRRSSGSAPARQLG
jgi:hypothetical protein